MDKIFRQCIDIHPEYTISASLLAEVSNTKQLLQLLLKGELNCALLNTTYIPDIFPVLIAATKAAHAHATGTMKTKGIHTELLYNLSPTTSICTALKTFGVKGDEESLLVVCVSKDNETDGIVDVVGKVDGVRRDMGDLSEFMSCDKIRKLYGVTDDELCVGSWSDAVTLRIATKDALCILRARQYIVPKWQVS